jgi:ribonucleoside-diphosphate reductase alpha chain
MCKIKSKLALMRSGEHNVARAYVLYRDKRNQERQAQSQASEQAQSTRSDGTSWHQRNG